jgi:hypothetical protein
MDARAVAVAREEIFVMGHLSLNGTEQPSRADDEPRVNEADDPAFSGRQYFQPTIGPARCR